MAPDSAMILRSNPEATMSNDTGYVYRQNSYVYYVTGFVEPNCVVVLRNNADAQFVMFVQKRDKEAETWTGRRYGVEGAKEHFGADEAFVIDELEEKLPELIKDCNTVYYSIAEAHLEYDPIVFESIRQARVMNRKKRRRPYQIVELGEILDKMRMIKRDEEIELMRKSAKIAAKAHIEAIKACKPGMYEYEIEAILDYEFRKSGGEGASYPSICASGDNATILHYIENSKQMEQGDLLLVDAGASYKYYASDITRTYPVSGTFTEAQKVVYQIVLEAQEAAIAAAVAGNSIAQVHEAAVKRLVTGLIELGVMSGDPVEIIEEKTYKEYYMHGTSHYLGIDVHDVGEYGTPEEEAVLPLRPGTVITVEPGLYFRSNDETVPEQYRGIGIRIEDDVLITEGDPEILTDDVPKTIEKIEQLMSSN